MTTVDNKPTTALSPREQVLRSIRGALANAKGEHAKGANTKGANSTIGTDREARLQNEALEGQPEQIKQHLAAHRRHTLPALPAGKALTEILLEKMDSVQITVTRLQTSAEVPAAVEEYLRENEIDGELVVSPAIQGLTWPAETLFSGAREALQTGRELTSVTPCLCAVAETGSIVTYTSKQTPTTLNYLPDNHVVVLHADQVVSHLEDAWTKQRTESNSVPRALNFLTGPSRTADIEQTIELGAHGPRRMHVLLVAQARDSNE